MSRVISDVTHFLTYLYAAYGLPLFLWDAGTCTCYYSLNYSSLLNIWFDLRILFLELILEHKKHLVWIIEIFSELHKMGKGEGSCFAHANMPCPLDPTSLQTTGITSSGLLHGKGFRGLWAVHKQQPICRERCLTVYMPSCWVPRTPCMKPSSRLIFWLPTWLLFFWRKLTWLLEGTEQWLFPCYLIWWTLSTIREPTIVFLHFSLVSFGTRGMCLSRSRDAYHAQVTPFARHTHLLGEIKHKVHRTSGETSLAFHFSG